MILLIDNYDSFSYNLFQLVGEVDCDILVYRNDKITLDEIEKLNPDAIVLSRVRENLKTLESAWIWLDNFMIEFQF